MKESEENITKHDTFTEHADKGVAGAAELRKWHMEGNRSGGSGGTWESGRSHEEHATGRSWRNTSGGGGSGGKGRSSGTKKPGARRDMEERKRRVLVGGQEALSTAARENLNRIERGLSFILFLRTWHTYAYIYTHMNMLTPENRFMEKSSNSVLNNASPDLDIFLLHVLKYILSVLLR